MEQLEPLGAEQILHSALYLSTLTSTGGLTVSLHTLLVAADIFKVWLMNMLTLSCYVNMCVFTLRREIRSPAVKRYPSNKTLMVTWFLLTVRRQILVMLEASRD